MPNFKTGFHTEATSPTPNMRIMHGTNSCLYVLTRTGFCTLPRLVNYITKSPGHTGKHFMDGWQLQAEVVAQGQAMQRATIPLHLHNCIPYLRTHCYRDYMYQQSHWICFSPQWPQGSTVQGVSIAQLLLYWSGLNNYRWPLVIILMTGYADGNKACWWLKLCNPWPGRSFNLGIASLCGP